MLESEARLLVELLARDDATRLHSDDEFTRSRGIDELRIEPDGPHEWAVILHWHQGDMRYGTRFTAVASLIGNVSATVQEMSNDVAMFVVDEPHHGIGTPDPDGRLWIKQG